ncbi:hypothetical protein M5K25_000674 [Dendrobium thyrsiflorum]|uniref:Uncharacterized protein n=1 Tax=Dendrobium thyrsiflorum TaxID=117978 RepID=A0ABD0WCL8_DENTH
MRTCRGARRACWKTSRCRRRSGKVSRVALREESELCNYVCTSPRRLARVRRAEVVVRRVQCTEARRVQTPESRRTLSRPPGEVWTPTGIRGDEARPGEVWTPTGIRGDEARPGEVWTPTGIRGDEARPGELWTPTGIRGDEARGELACLRGDLTQRGTSTRPPPSGRPKLSYSGLVPPSTVLQSRAKRQPHPSQPCETDTGRTRRLSQKKTGTGAKSEQMQPPSTAGASESLCPEANWLAAKRTLHLKEPVLSGSTKVLSQRARKPTKSKSSLTPGNPGEVQSEVKVGSAVSSDNTVPRCKPSPKGSCSETPTVDRYPSWRKLRTQTSAGMEALARRDKSEALKEFSLDVAQTTSDRKMDFATASRTLSIL